MGALCHRGGCPLQRSDGLETEPPAQCRWLRWADLCPRAQPLPRPLTGGPRQPCWAPSTCTDRPLDRAALGGQAGGCACTRPHAVAAHRRQAGGLRQGPRREQPGGLAHCAGQLRFSRALQPRRPGSLLPGPWPSLPSCAPERLWEGSQGRPSAGLACRTRPPGSQEGRRPPFPRVALPGVPPGGGR